MGLAALVRAMEVLGRAQVDMRDAPDPRVSLEVALVRLAHPEADDSPEALLARIERLEAADRTAGATPAAPPATGGPAPPGLWCPDVRSTRPARRISRRTVPARPVGRRPGATVGNPVAGRKALGAFRRATAGPHGEPAGEGSGTTGDSTPVEPVPSEAPDAEDPVSPPTGSAAAPFPSRDQLVQAWGDHVIGRLRPKAKALFQAGRFVGVDGERAVFGLPNETHRNRCEEVRGEIEAALSEQFGRPVGLELVVDPGAEPAPVRSGPPPDAPAPTSGPPPTGPPADGADPGPADVGAAAPTPHPTPVTTPTSPTTTRRSSTTAELGEVADVDNSAEARVLQAFPGAEEVG